MIVRCLLLFLVAGMPGLLAGESKHPHVLVILTDDQGWGDLGFHGNRQIETPYLDALAGDGVRLTHFFVQPVCSPTRAEFLTGRYHPRDGVYSTSQGGERLDPDVHTIGNMFQEAGYATAVIGKWHNGQQWPYHPNARGFDRFYGFASGHWGHYFDYILEEDNALVRFEGFIVDHLTDYAMDWISARGESPFFLWFTLPTPHSPMQVPDEFWERFKDRPLEQRGTDPKREDIGHTRAALAMVENIDANLGRLFAHLKALKLERDTIVVFFNDNGPNGDRWNGGMRGRKGSTDEGGVRSPLFLRWPGGGLEGGRDVEVAAGAIDLLPTLATLAGLYPDYPYPLDGRDLTPFLRGDAPHESGRILFQHWSDRVSARTRHFRMDHEGRLYRVAKDPGMTREVSGRYPETAARLEMAIQRFRETVLADAFDRDRPFTVGHPGSAVTWLPARDAQYSGNIERSNRWPNDSFLRGWASPEDRIFWDVEVLGAGTYRAEVFYACPESDLGAMIELRADGGSRVQGEVEAPHDPPLLGAEDDRISRQESYVKLFRPLELGLIDLLPGPQQLILQAPRIPGARAMDFQMLKLTRVSP